MASLAACLVNFALPLMGIRRFFSETERMPDRIAALRSKPSLRPKAKWQRDFVITEDTTRDYAVVTITPRLARMAAGRRACRKFFIDVWTPPSNRMIARAKEQAR